MFPSKRLFIVPPALSLLLCVGSVVLWVSTYRTGYDLHYCKCEDRWGWAPATHRSLFVARGLIAFEKDTYPEERGSMDPPIHQQGYAFRSFPLANVEANTDWIGLGTPRFHWSALGFQIEASDWTPAPLFGAAAPPVGHGFLLALPIWPATVLLAAWPLFWFRRRRRRKARCRGHLCLSCGYDLRASEDRCPECGTPIPSNAGANA